MHWYMKSKSEQYVHQYFGQAVIDTISYAYDRSLGNAIRDTRYFVVPKLYSRRTTFSFIHSKQSRVGLICVGQFLIFKLSGRRKKQQLLQRTITYIVCLIE